MEVVSFTISAQPVSAVDPPALLEPAAPLGSQPPSYQFNSPSPFLTGGVSPTSEQFPAFCIAVRRPLLTPKCLSARRFLVFQQFSSVVSGLTPLLYSIEHLMARHSSFSSASLRTRLSSFTDYLEAVAELRTRLLHSSPSCLISDPEELISLAEVAKSTLQNHGISLHTFSSCPDYLSPYKAAYFGLLLQLQAHSHDTRIESKELQARLNRLLFPLSTQLRVSTKTETQAVTDGYAVQLRGVKRPGTERNSGSTETNLVSSGLAASTTDPYHQERSDHLSGPPNLPPNVMLPPPTPLRHGMQSAKSSGVSTTIPSSMQPSDASGRTPTSLHGRPSNGRVTSHDTMYFKRRNGEPIDLHTAFQKISSPTLVYNKSGDTKSRNSFEFLGKALNGGEADDSDLSNSSSEEDSSDEDASHVIIPSHSPLRRTFGIFCTGKGRGAFSGTVHTQRRRPRSRQGKAQLSPRRSSEVGMDTEV